jgi:hypothetical protein
MLPRLATYKGGIGPWGRLLCIPVQQIATGCKAGALSPRYFWGFSRFPNLRVAGSSPVARSRAS